MTSDVLFILKRRPDFDPEKHSPLGLSTGLFNSANYMNQMLQLNGVNSNIVVVTDNNDIDREVTKYRPKYVIIEALWVVPSKFPVLIELHPTVKWIIRLHSEMPFIASEGIAMNWIGDYMSYPELTIGVNAPRMLEEVKTLAKNKEFTKEQINEKIVYLPNYYPQEYKSKTYKLDHYWIDIGCFGAIRPLKNHLTQAFGALKFAGKINRQLRFHINVGRIEMKGDPVLNNIKGLFLQMADYGHKLILHEWMTRDDFLILCSKMDIGLQSTFSETFNIVGADLISQGVPLIGSNEIPWSSKMFNAIPENSDNICSKLMLTHMFPGFNVSLNKRSLSKYTSNSEKIWIRYFKGKVNGLNAKVPQSKSEGTSLA